MAAIITDSGREREFFDSDDPQFHVVQRTNSYFLIAFWTQKQKQSKKGEMIRLNPLGI